MAKRKRAAVTGGGPTVAAPILAFPVTPAGPRGGLPPELLAAQSLAESSGQAAAADATATVPSTAAPWIRALLIGGIVFLGLVLFTPLRWYWCALIALGLLVALRLFAARKAEG